MKQIAIVAGGPALNIPELKQRQHSFHYWIGCDRGAYEIIDQNLPLNMAIGDFDSVTKQERIAIENYADKVISYNVEKDASDLELAVEHSLTLGEVMLTFFGVTGGRLDHELMVIFLLEKLLKVGIPASIIDQQNIIQLYKPGKYQVEKDSRYPIISFLPVTDSVTSLSLTGFYYPLQSAHVTRGDSLTLSNHLDHEYGHFSFDTGILMMIRSSEQVK
ncbi:thiamine pyrophosphokinase [Amphibacillus marinus]|uniref:Thiamine diphosphokinase n=1 Tax=Amphibacillus marinus TaxID=872970 RepID=A0A1H8HXL6_9BACI|nr:thiamine diphosphokinase [Amphibacillus marinus]SEN60943.1 thiamine pyrophosphokinase [Amphibacillus marinus]